MNTSNLLDKIASSFTRLSQSIDDTAKSLDKHMYSDRSEGLALMQNFEQGVKEASRGIGIALSAYNQLTAEEREQLKLAMVRNAAASRFTGASHLLSQLVEEQVEETTVIANHDTKAKNRKAGLINLINGLDSLGKTLQYSDTSPAARLAKPLAA